MDNKGSGKNIADDQFSFICKEMYRCLFIRGKYQGITNLVCTENMSYVSGIMSHCTEKRNCNPIMRNLWYNILQCNKSTFLDITNFISSLSEKTMEQSLFSPFSLYCKYVADNLYSSLQLEVCSNERPHFDIYRAIFLRNILFRYAYGKDAPDDVSNDINELFTKERIIGNIDEKIKQYMIKYISLGEFFFGLYDEIQQHLIASHTRYSIQYVVDKLLKKIEPSQDFPHIPDSYEGGKCSLGDAISKTVSRQIGVPLIPCLVQKMMENDLAFENYSFFRPLSMVAFKSYFIRNKTKYKPLNKGKTIFLHNINSCKQGPDGGKRHIRLGPYRKPIMSLHCASQCRNALIVKKVLQNILQEITVLDIFSPFIQFTANIDKTLFWTWSAFQSLPCRAKCSHGKPGFQQIQSLKLSHNISHNNQIPFAVQDKKIRICHDINVLSSDSGNEIKKVPLIYSHIYLDEKKNPHLIHQENALLLNCNGTAVPYSTLTPQMRAGKIHSPDILLQIPCARRLCYEKVNVCTSFEELIHKCRKDPCNRMTEKCLIDCCKYQETCAERFVKEFIDNYEQNEVVTQSQFNKYLEYMKSLTESAHKNLCNGCIIHFTCRDRHHDDDTSYLAVRRYILPRLLSYMKL